MVSCFYVMMYRTIQNYVVWWVLTTTNYELVSQKFQNLRKDLNKVKHVTEYVIIAMQMNTIVN